MFSFSIFAKMDKKTGELVKVPPELSKIEILFFFLFSFVSFKQLVLFLAGNLGILGKLHGVCSTTRSN